MNYVLAWNMEQARDLARKKGWTPREWRYAWSYEQLKGVENFDVWEIRSPEYRPTRYQQQFRDEMLQFIEVSKRPGTVITHHVVQL